MIYRPNKNNANLSLYCNMAHATANGMRMAALKQMSKDYRNHGEACAKWYTIVAPVNDCALMTMHDAIEYIKNSPKWRKRGIRAACEECERMDNKYNRNLMLALKLNDSLNIDRTQFMTDYLDSMQDAWEHDTFIIRMSISNFLLKQKYTRDVELASYILTAYNVLVFACHFFDWYIRIAQDQFGVDIRKEFADGKLGRIMEKFKIMAMSVDTQEVQGLYEDKNARAAIQALANRVTSPEVSNDAAAKALDYNRDVLKWAEGLGETIEQDCKSAENRMKEYIGLK